MTAEQPPAPIDYARPAAAPRPGFWRFVCFALGWTLTVFGGLGFLLHCVLIAAMWYDSLSQPELARRLWASLNASVVFVGLGIVFLWLRYRKRGAR